MSALVTVIFYLCDFLLFEFSATSVLLNIVRDDGSVHIPAGFGYKPELFELIPERLVTTDTPSIDHYALA